MNDHHPEDITEHCPCGSGRPYGDCCGPLVTGRRTARTPEELMRSRYCAFKQGITDYILETWHPDTRPPVIEQEALYHWCGLEIIRTLKGRSGDEQGFVEFRAETGNGLSTSVLHEKSRFVRKDGRWLYLDGKVIATPENTVEPKSGKVGRNSPCACGSGRKFKKCCGR